MVVPVVNMALRAFGAPFPGAIEIVAWLAALTSGLALGYTQVHRGHVAIALLVERWPKRVQAALEAVISLLAMFLFAVVSYRLMVYAARLAEVGSLSETMKLPYYPFVYALAIGFVSLTLALLFDVWRSVRALGGGK